MEKTNPENKGKKGFDIEIFDEELEKRILENLSEKATSSKVAIQGLSLFKMLGVIKNTQTQIKELLTQYENIEDLFLAKRYHPMVIGKSYLKPKLLFVGDDHTFIKEIVEEFEEWGIYLSEQIKTIEKFGKNAEFCEKCGLKLENTLGFFIKSQTLMNVMTDTIKRIKDNTKIKFPMNETTKNNAKSFRTLLINTQAIGRQAELLFTYFLHDILKEQGQLRRDYQEIETATNTLYSRLYVSQGKLQLDQNLFGDAIRSIMKSLNNINGDMNASQSIILMTIMGMITSSTTNPAQLRNAFMKSLEGNRL